MSYRSQYSPDAEEPTQHHHIELLFQRHRGIISLTKHCVQVFYKVNVEDGEHDTVIG